MVDALPTYRVDERLRSSEKPSKTGVLSLPVVEIPGYGVGEVRLAMHTDNLGILISALSDSPYLTSLKIEGRVITDEQFEKLGRDPVYRFYMSGRLLRVSQSDTIDNLVYTMPGDLNIDHRRATRLLNSSFSPSTLANDVGFKTGYYEAKDLVHKWQKTIRVNEFLPQFGGVNELSIGSDSLTQQELDEEIARITERFVIAQTKYFNPGFKNLVSLPGIQKLSSSSSNSYISLSSFPNKLDLKLMKNDFNTKEPIINRIKKNYNLIIDNKYPSSKNLYDKKY